MSCFIKIRLVGPFGIIDCWTHSRLGEIWIYNERMRYINKECSVRDLLGLRGGYPFVRFAAVANQLAAAWMWLADAIPVEYLLRYSLLYFLLFSETHDLVWEIISVSEKRIKNCIVKIIDIFFLNDKGELFPLTPFLFPDNCDSSKSKAPSTWNLVNIADKG